MATAVIQVRAINWTSGSGEKGLQVWTDSEGESLQDLLRDYMCGVKEMSHG